MRLEFNIALFAILLFGVVILGYICKIQKCKKLLSKLSFVVLCSLLLPALIPAHGEIVVALPNGALFTKTSELTWGIGIFFIVIYSTFILILLERIIKD